MKVAGRRSQVAGRRSQVAGRRSQVAGRRSQVAGIACGIIAALAVDVRSQHQGQWLAPYTHTGTTVGTGTAAWPVNFNAINMAVIPNKSSTGANPNDVVIAWDSRWRNPATQNNSVPWDQRYTVGNPEVPSSFVNRWVTIPLGPVEGGVPLFYGDLFCSCHCWLPDGRLFIAGGNARYSSSTHTFLGSRYVGVWDPRHANSAANHFGWVHVAGGSLGKPMRLARWYPTCTLISDRYVMVSGGVTDTVAPKHLDPAWDTYELFDAHPSVMDWVQDTSTFPSVVKLFDGPRGSFFGNNNLSHRLGEYPRMHFLSNNKVICCGTYAYSATIDPDPLLTPSNQNPLLAPSPNHWSPLLQLVAQSWRGESSSVLVPNVGRIPGLRDEVMIIGGGHYSANTVFNNSIRLLAGTAGAVWGGVQDQGSPRMVANGVLMPNGDVVLVGGSSDHYHFPGNQRIPVYKTMVWDRVHGWQGDATQIGKRMYHSTAVLLPSGKLASAGGDIRTQIGATPNDLADWEVYVPRNLANGQNQPQFAGAWAAPGYRSMGFGSIHKIEFVPMDDDPVTRVVLMRPCSNTHHIDMDQQYIELKTQLFDSNDQVDASAPAQPSFTGTTQGSVEALPGWYMLFLVNASGATSHAKWVHLL
jgi:hypothetical protein